jgi:hypothetical protein
MLSRNEAILDQEFAIPNHGVANALTGISAGAIVGPMMDFME